jgi:hypothetical protein
MKVVQRLPRHPECTPDPMAARRLRLRLDLAHPALRIAIHGIEQLRLLDREQQEAEPVIGQCHQRIGRKPHRVRQSDDDRLVARNDRQCAEDRVAQTDRAGLAHIRQIHVAGGRVIMLQDVGLRGRDHATDLGRTAAHHPLDQVFAHGPLTARGRSVPPSSRREPTGSSSLLNAGGWMRVPLPAAGMIPHVTPSPDDRPATRRPRRPRPCRPHDGLRWVRPASAPVRGVRWPPGPRPARPRRASRARCCLRPGSPRRGGRKRPGPAIRLTGWARRTPRPRTGGRSGFSRGRSCRPGSGSG